MCCIIRNELWIAINGAAIILSKQLWYFTVNRNITEFYNHDDDDDDDDDKWHLYSTNAV